MTKIEMTKLVVIDTTVGFVCFVRLDDGLKYIQVTAAVLAIVYTGMQMFSWVEKRFKK